MQNVIGSHATQATLRFPARTAWLAMHNVHTEFVDAGIGCCWFARQGDDEPVTGGTENEAIARLAVRGGLDSFFEA